MRFFRFPISPLLLAVLAALPAGCAKRDTAVSIGNRTQTLEVGNLSEPNDLDPQIADSQQTFNIVMALMEGLAQYDPKDCHPVPAAAASWEHNADATVWTFHLRPNGRWSNGDPVTAHDFVFAYKRMLSPGLGAEYAYLLYCLKNGEAFNQGRLTDFSQVGAHAVDDHTLRLELSHPVPFLPALTCHDAWYPLYEATILKFGAYDRRGTAWTRPGNYVGNGPFVLIDWVPNQVVRCARSPTYWDRGNVKLNGVDFYPIEDESTEETAFRNGQLHVTSTIPIEKIAVYKNDHRGYLRHGLIFATYIYRFNVTRPPLNDVRVRRALAWAIDRDALVSRVAKGGQTPAHHFTPPIPGGFVAEGPGVPTDIPAAQKMLAEAGYPGGKGFPPVEILYNTNQAHRQIAEAIQQMWRRNLGINVTLVNQEGKVYTDTMRRLDYQIARFAWVGDYLDPSTFLDIMTGDSGNNQTGWKNDEYDRLIAAAQQTADQTERYADFQRCEDILAQEVPFAPIYFYKHNYLRLPNVRGWDDNLLDLHPLKGVYLAP